MTRLDLELEKFYKSIAGRPKGKDEETNTYFDRNIYYYDRDEVNRQIPTSDSRVTYEDHRKAISTATTIFRKTTQHDIAMCILTDRYFTVYRNKAFQGLGGFVQDYSFLIRKIGMVQEPSGIVHSFNLASKLAEFTEPTVVQINHIVGIVKPVNLPTTQSLGTWVSALNASANESTTYRLVGLKIG